jgi:hypothetical protein
MGTNFYGIDKRTGERVHIGKRSAAGLYCWDCRLTLCKDGEESVHHSRPLANRLVHQTFGNTNAFTKWYKACPLCHKKPVDETLDKSAAGRELGFNDSKPKAKKGVATCCSFTWAIQPEALALHIRYVQDEYGRRYNQKAFVAVLCECPIQYKHSIGSSFS